MTPRYIAFTLTKNWFGQAWAGMGNWYYMGHWINTWNFRKKRDFFSKFQHFLLFCEWFKCYFWIPHPKINKSSNLHKNSVNQTQNMNNDYRKFPRWSLRRWKRRTVVQTFKCNISETIWDRSLKFGTFTYLHIMYIYSKSHWNLKRWVSGGMSHFDVEFPKNNFLKIWYWPTYE